MYLMIEQIQQVRFSSIAVKKIIDTAEVANFVIAEVNSRDKTTKGSTKG